MGSLGPQRPLSLNELVIRARRLAAEGDLDGATALLVEAVSRGSTSPDVFRDLGTILLGRGQLAAAVIQFEIALTLDPRSHEARKNLCRGVEAMSLAAIKEGRWNDAAAGYGRLTVLDPGCALFQTNAGLALREARLLDQALPYLRRAAALDAGNPAVHVNLGSVLYDLNRRESAGVLERAIELDPRNVLALVNLAAVRHRLGELAQAAEAARRALALSPDQIEAHANLAVVLRELGEIPSSLGHYRRALQLRPDNPAVFSSYLLARQGDPDADSDALLADHQEWATRFAVSLDPGPTGGFGARDRSPDRRLRVGYVSADLRSHSVASFIEPIIRAHDRSAVEVYCYSSAAPDHVTARIQTESRPDVWRDVRTLTDPDLARLIVEDGIDVLVDLSGHTDGNRLLTFARRPAPVQVTYCGYPGTTGLAAIGWRLTDAIADPEPAADQEHVERLWRLPHGFLCYQAHSDAPPVFPLPALSGAGMTFGSFNNLSKLGDGVLDLWAKLLDAVPGSRLLLKARALSEHPARDRLRLAFSRRGIDPRRVDFAPFAATSAEHLALYGQVDVALDPLPYNGTTTTCEALWMGVPVITWLGRRHPGRVGASLLTRIGFSELVAGSTEQYLEIAVRLSRDLDSLAALRAGLRARMASSALMDASLISRDLEAAYREMWRGFCSGPPG